METETKTRLKDLALKFKEIRDRKDALKLESKQLGEDEDLVQAEIRTALEGMDGQSVKFDDIGTVFLSNFEHCKVVPGKEEEFLAWLDSHDLGSLAPRKANYQTLNASYREWTAGDKPLPPKEVLDTYTEVRVGLKRS